MADEQTPPKRDVNELFTLDASNPIGDHDGPLAHLLSISPVSDLGRSPGDPDGSSAGTDDLPDIADVSGLEDLYVTTADLPLANAEAEPMSSTDRGWAGPVASSPAESVTVAGEQRPVEPVPPEFQPVSVDLERPAHSDPLRTAEVGRNLRFSTEARSRAATGSSPAHNHRPYPAPLVPNAVPTPVAPSRSVRVPGQERPRGALYIALVEMFERRWFWASAAGFLGLVLLGVLTVGNIVPNPLSDGRTDVVAENRLPAAPEIRGATEPSEPDTSSSTGAGTSGPEPRDPTTSVESTTSSTSITSRRRIVTTARPTVRPTTVVTPTSTVGTSSTATSASSTTTTEATSTTVESSSTTDPSSSSTPSTGSTTTDTTGDDSTTTMDDGSTTSSSSSTSTSTSTTAPSSDP